MAKIAEIHFAETEIQNHRDAIADSELLNKLHKFLILFYLCLYIFEFKINFLFFLKKYTAVSIYC
jgi:hypothetical protein